MINTIIIDSIIRKMSKSHYIIEDVYSIYSSINEEKDTQVEEIDNFAGDVYAVVATSMLHEGYSVSGVLGFLSTASDEEIIERFGDFNESIITESIISEEYISEQVVQLDELVGAALRVLGGGLKAAKYAKPGLLSKLGQGLQGAGRAASRVAQQGPKASSVVRAGLSKVKSAATGALGALKSKAGSAVSSMRSGAAKVGSAVKSAVVPAVAGYVGAKMGSGDSGESKPAASKPDTAPAKPVTAPAARTPAPAKPKLNVDQQAVNREYDRLRKSGDMAGAAAYGKRMAAAGASRSDFKMPKDTKKESYDLVLDYLLSGGHAETVEEAHYIMLRLDADHVQEIVESAS